MSNSMLAVPSVPNNVVTKRYVPLSMKGNTDKWNLQPHLGPLNWTAQNTACPPQKLPVLPPPDLNVMVEITIWPKWKYSTGNIQCYLTLNSPTDMTCNSESVTRLNAYNVILTPSAVEMRNSSTAERGFQNKKEKDLLVTHIVAKSCREWKFTLCPLHEVLKYCKCQKA